MKKITYKDVNKRKVAWIEDAYLVPKLNEAIDERFKNLDFTKKEKKEYKDNKRVKVKGLYVSAHSVALKGRLDELIELAKKNLKQVNLENAEEILNKYPFELSGGMLQRIMVAIVIGLDAKIIIADEVTSALDSYNRYEMIKIFKELNKLGKSIILITHDYYLMKSISERCLVMEDGEIIEEFNPKLNPELIKEKSEFGAKLLETTIYKRKGS